MGCPEAGVSLQFQETRKPHAVQLRVPHPQEIRSRAQMARARKVRTRGEGADFCWI